MLHEAKTPAGPVSWDLKHRRACLSFFVSLQTASGRLQMKLKRHRNQIMPGNKIPEDVIVVVHRLQLWSLEMKGFICRRVLKYSAVVRDGG